MHRPTILPVLVMVLLLTMPRPAFCDKADDYILQGRARMARGDFKGALADFTNAIQLKPDYAEAFYYRGLMKMSIGPYDPVKKRLSGDYDGAIADFTKAIQLKPNYVDAYITRGVLKSRKDELDGAIADYVKAIELNPDETRAYFNRGNALKDKGNFDGAIADYTKAIELKPDDTFVYVIRGRTKGLKGDLNGAVADFIKAIRVKPDEPNALARDALASVEKQMQMADSGGAETALTGERTVKEEHEVYIWRVTAVSHSGGVMPSRWTIRGILGAALLPPSFAGNLQAEQANTFGAAVDPGFEKWQFAPENEDDICTVDSGGGPIIGGDYFLSAPIVFQSASSAPGSSKKMWLSPAGAHGKIIGAAVFQPSIYPASDGTLKLGGAITIIHSPRGATYLTAPATPVFITGTIRFPKDRWTPVGAGFSIRNGGLQFDETGAFLMPGTEYRKQSQ